MRCRELQIFGILESFPFLKNTLDFTPMAHMKKNNDEYVSPVAETLDLFVEGTLLTGSQDVGLGFDFEDGDMVEGDEIIIGG